MYLLENAEIAVSILDPATDLDRCGSRYCVGGYIYQVTDPSLGPLLAGPQYPAPYPDTFDGQGAPDMFVIPLGVEDAAVGDEVGIIGVGRVRRSSPIEPFSVRHNPEVVEFLPWSVQQRTDGITMRTEQTFRSWSYALVREVSLDRRTIRSRTSLVCLGEVPLPVLWFPHPFYPPTPDGRLCRFSIPVSMPDNPGFFLDESGWVYQKPGYDWSKGHFQALDFAREGMHLTVDQAHPLLGEVSAQTDYAPVSLPIWGNARTFSFEPYFQATVQPGDELAWGIDYRF